MTDDNGDAMLQILETMAPLVSMVSGVRQQFMDQGWSADNAEQAAVELFRMAGRGKSK